MVTPTQTKTTWATRQPACGDRQSASGGIPLGEPPASGSLGSWQPTFPETTTMLVDPLKNLHQLIRCCKGVIYIYILEMKGQDVPYISAGAGFSVGSSINTSQSCSYRDPPLLIWLVHSCLVSQLTWESHRRSSVTFSGQRHKTQNCPKTTQVVSPTAGSYLGPQNLLQTPFFDRTNPGHPLPVPTAPGTLNWSLRWEVPLRLHREPLKPSPPKPLQLSMYLRNFRNLRYLHTSISVPNHTIKPRPPRNL